MAQKQPTSTNELSMEPMGAIALYVPKTDRIAFEGHAAKLGAPIRFNNERQCYEIESAIVNPAIRKDLVQNYVEGTKGHERWLGERERVGGMEERVIASAGLMANQATGQEQAAARDTVAVVENDAIPGATPVAGRREENQMSRSVAYAARAKGAEEAGLQFVAKFIRFGFMMASPKSEERFLPQSAALEKASADELREVGARTAEAHRELANKEFTARFDHAVKNTPEWKAKYAEAMRKPDRGQAIYALRGEFMRLPFDAMKAAAPEVRLDPRELSQISALARGFRSICDRYLVLTKQPLNIRISGGSKAPVRQAEVQQERTSMVGKALKGIQRDGGFSR